MRLTFESRIPLTAAALAAVFALGACGGGGGSDAPVAAPPSAAPAASKEAAALAKAHALNADAMGQIKAERAWQQQRTAGQR